MGDGMNGMAAVGVAVTIILVADRDPPHRRRCRTRSKARTARCCRNLPAGVRARLRSSDGYVAAERWCGMSGMRDVEDFFYGLAFTWLVISAYLAAVLGIVALLSAL